MRLEVAEHLRQAFGGTVIPLHGPGVEGGNLYALESPTGGWPKEWCDKLSARLKHMRENQIRIRENR